MKTARTHALTLLLASVAQAAWAVPNPIDLGAALQSNNLAAVREYKEQGGDVNAGGCRALFLAYRDRKQEIATYLESVGARINPGLLFAHYLSARHDLRVVAGIVRLLYLDHKRAPSRSELESELARRDLSRFSLDYWGNPVQYEVVGQGFKVRSRGADGKPGGSGFDMDISSSSTEEELDAASKQSDPNGICAER